MASLLSIFKSLILTFDEYIYINYAEPKLRFSNIGGNAIRLEIIGTRDNVNMKLKELYKGFDINIKKCKNLLEILCLYEEEENKTNAINLYCKAQELYLVIKQSMYNIGICASRISHRDHP